MQAKNGFKNLIILLIAPILALSLFYLTHDLSGLTASVLDVLELKAIEKNWRGVAYKTQNQTFELFGSEVAKKGEMLTFQIFYNPESIKLQLDQLLPSTAKIDASESWKLTVNLVVLTNAPLEREWFSLPFSGEEEKDILLGSATLRSGEALTPLSIWNLNIPVNDDVLP